MRIAFFGGSFDPPHRGHLAVAQAALSRFELDRVLMAPAGAQPLKPEGLGATYKDRLAMVELAVLGLPQVEASAVDAPKPDGHPNFTVDVLTEIKAELGAGDELFFLLGADAFLSLRQWRSAEELPFLCRFIVAGRPGFSLGAVAQALPEGIRAASEGRLDTDFPSSASWSLHNERGEHSQLYLMSDLQEDISATDIRAAIAGEVSAEGVLSPAVLRYIQEKGLYR